eukprot:SAG25_NODE_944_length_4650_cov_9.607119_1_plen_173_part_00
MLARRCVQPLALRHARALSSAPTRRTTKLKEMFQSKDLSYLMVRCALPGCAPAPAASAAHTHRSTGWCLPVSPAVALRPFSMISSVSPPQPAQEAHNGLSAKIVQETGFQGIWASGLSISASLGVRDSNEASWTQVLDCVEYMVDACDLPILLDGDTGYGNFNNARRVSFFR